MKPRALYIVERLEPWFTYAEWTAVGHFVVKRDAWTVMRNCRADAMQRGRKTQYRVTTYVEKEKP